MNVVKSWDTIDSEARAVINSAADDCGLRVNHDILRSFVYPKKHYLLNFVKGPLFNLDIKTGRGKIYISEKTETSIRFAEALENHGFEVTVYE